MPGTPGPKLGLIYGYSPGESGWGVVAFTPNFQELEALVQGSVKSHRLATPPGSPATGDAYVVAASPTGAWSGHATHVAFYTGSAWVFYTPKIGWQFYNELVGGVIWFNGTVWRHRGPILLARETTSGTTITGTTSETTSDTVSVPGNAMGLKGSVHAWALWSIGNPASANAKTMRIKFGGSSVASQATGATSETLFTGARIWNRAAANSQIYVPTSILGNFGVSASLPGTLAIDTTSSFNITFTGQLNSAAGGAESMTREVLEVWLYPDD